MHGRLASARKFPSEHHARFERFYGAKWIRLPLLRHGFKQVRNDVITLTGVPPGHGG
jgi:hypothetical protein